MEKSLYHAKIDIIILRLNVKYVWLTINIPIAIAFKLKMQTLIKIKQNTYSFNNGSDLRVSTRALKYIKYHFLN